MAGVDIALCPGGQGFRPGALRKSEPVVWRLSRVPPQVSSDELVAVFEMEGGTFTRRLEVPSLKSVGSVQWQCSLYKRQLGILPLG